MKQVFCIGSKKTKGQFLILEAVLFCLSPKENPFQIQMKGGK